MLGLGKGVGHADANSDNRARTARLLEVEAVVAQQAQRSGAALRLAVVEQELGHLWNSEHIACLGACWAGGWRGSRQCAGEGACGCCICVNPLRLRTERQQLLQCTWITEHTCVGGDTAVWCNHPALTAVGGHIPGQLQQVGLLGQRVGGPRNELQVGRRRRC